MKELAYSLTGYRRLIQHYHWYVVEERNIFNDIGWQFVWKGYNKITGIKILENVEKIC